MTDCYGLGNKHQDDESGDNDGDNDDDDRFLALHWSSSYKSRVTTRHASLTVLAIKLAMVLITAAGAAVDTDILQCRYLITM